MTTTVQTRATSGLTVVPTIASVGGATTIRVFLLDDHPLVRGGLVAFLGDHDGIEVVGEAATASAAVRSIRSLRPDVALLDIGLAEGNGLDVCREVTDRCPEVKCVMLTGVADERAVSAARNAGAVGFLVKSIDPIDIVDTVRKVAAGRQLLDDLDVRFAESRLDQRGEGAVASLTPQENRIFELIGRGCTNRQIAHEMLLAEKTVKNYVSNVLSRLGLSRRAEAAALAARLDERAAGWCA